jgi:hypothetical protein
VPPDRTQADLGFTHIGFASKDIHADYARLRRMGVAFYNEPIEYRPGVWNAYFFMDLWYRANRLAGTLPARYRDASLVEMVDDMDIGYHAVVPDF